MLFCLWIPRCTVPYRLYPILGLLMVILYGRSHLCVNSAVERFSRGSPEGVANVELPSGGVLCLLLTLHKTRKYLPRDYRPTAVIVIRSTFYLTNQIARPFGHSADPSLNQSFNEPSHPSTNPSIDGAVNRPMNYSAVSSPQLTNPQSTDHQPLISSLDQSPNDQSINRPRH